MKSCFFERLLGVSLAISIAGCGVFPKLPSRGAAQYRLPAGAIVSAKRADPEREIAFSYVVDSAHKSEWRGCSGAPGAGGMDNVVGAVILSVWLLTCFIDNAAAADRAARNVNEATSPGEASKAVTGSLIRSVHLTRPLSARVQDLACVKDMGEFPERPSCPFGRIPDRTQNAGTQEFVMLLSVTELRLRTTSHKNIFWFELVAQGQLMRLGEDFALDEFTAKTVTPLVTVESWTPESAQRLSTQFESALDDLAGRFVSEWIKPRLLGAH